MATRTLFDLHRNVKVCEITDGEGDPIKFALQAPNQAENSRLMMMLNDEHVRAEAEFKASSLKSQLTIQAMNWSHEELGELILRMELGATIEEADLAPNSGTTDAEKDGVTEERAREIEENTAVKRRQDRRREILKSQTIDTLREAFVDLQAKVATITQATAKWSLAQLCIMVRDPTPNDKGVYERVFTDREDSIEDKCSQCGRGTPNLNYIGLLAPQTVDILMNERTIFLSDISTKNLRKQAEAPDFTPAGKSAKKRRVSLGETKLNPPTSPPAPSVSSATASG